MERSAETLAGLRGPRGHRARGPLHVEYLCWVPSSVIFFGAGARLRRPRAPAKALRLAAAAALHAHVAAPALAVCAVTVFSAALHGPVINGALLSSVGSGCAWLSLALAPRAALPAAASYTASLLATPLSALLLCGRTSIPPLSEVLSTTMRTLIPFTVGCATTPMRQEFAVRLAALALVYAECCERLNAAEGGLLAGDVLATLLVEVCWLALSAGACAAYARWWGAAGARLIALVAVPKALDQGWGAAAACRLPALARLPAVFAAPAQALLLAALHTHDDSDYDEQDELPF
ncbi:uncharacterized protein LOC134677893 [Cydia fagiglandana]|uniref:uncharacterized protein LOC134677893 n=1 Tax=Cydia fagiglandana TaxID=1458189 RepID=UPI002FEE25A3